MSGLPNVFIFLDKIYLYTAISVLPWTLLCGTTLGMLLLYISVLFLYLVGPFLFTFLFLEEGLGADIVQEVGQCW